MSKTINILGDTPKEQWLSAIKIFETCIVSNLDCALTEISEIEHDNEYDVSMRQNIETARSETINFANEMRRLADNLPD